MTLRCRWSTHLLSVCISTLPASPVTGGAGRRRQPARSWCGKRRFDFVQRRPGSRHCSSRGWAASQWWGMDQPPAGRSPQIPAAVRMLGVNPATCVQIAFVKIPRAGRGRRSRHRTPTAVGIGRINPSATVQVAPIIILAARLGVGRAHVPRQRDQSHRQRGQQPEDAKAHDVSPYPPRCRLPPGSGYL